jgi:hypothetical protein
LGQRIASTTANRFKIVFTKNGAVIHDISSPCDGYVVFSISNLEDGRYAYKISDSLNLFGYTQDSIVINNSIYANTTNFLGYIERKPTYSFLNVKTVDTIWGGYTGKYVEFTSSDKYGIMGNLSILFYKNNSVSSDNSRNYCKVRAFQNIKSVFPIYSFILFDSETYTYLHKGDSVYYAIYPIAEGRFSGDRLKPVNQCGERQYTALGSHRILIPHKLR